MNRKYIWGYPRAAIGHMWFQAGAVAGCFLGLVAPLLLLSGIGGYCSVRTLWNGGFAWWPALSLVIQVPAFVFSVLGAVAGVCLLILIPRFILDLTRKRLPVTMQATSYGWCRPDYRNPKDRYGEWLARNCRVLDDIAERVGVVPLYELGLGEEGRAKKS